MKTIFVVFSLFLGMAIANAAPTRTMIKTSELSKAITENIASAHRGWKATEAFKLDNKGVISYEVIIKKSNYKKVLYYDKDGKYLRMKASHTTAHKSSVTHKSSTEHKSMSKKPDQTKSTTKKN